MLKRMLIHIRSSMKMLIAVGVSLLVTLGIIAYFYKISYIVKIDGEFIGYVDNRSHLQKRINEYIDGDESDDNLAYMQIDILPTYEVCLLKRNTNIDEDEIFDRIKENSMPYYRYYAIAENDEEKLYTAKFSECEEILDKLKEKKSTNLQSLKILEKYETEMKEMTDVETGFKNLYKEPPSVVVLKKVATGSVNTATNISGGKVNLGISLIRPVSGVLTSRFGERSSVRSSAHTGLDIATSKGTPIVAAASGTVTFSGMKGSYGYLMVISHGNGVQTYYGHCNQLYYSAGASVTQGQAIATVGSTGNSTGPHLHFEIRVNGVAYNPQNYLY